MGTHDRREGGGVDPDLLVTVEVEVESLPGQSFVTPKPSLGGREVPPDRIAKVGQIEPAEDTVPVRVVALRSPDGTSSLRVVPSGATERGESLHLLVHPIRLGVLHLKISPVRAPNERAVRPRGPGLAEVALESRKPQCRVGRQRPALHLPVGTSGEIGESTARDRDQRLVQPAQHDLAVVHQSPDRRHESVEPTLAIHPILGSGPAAELLSIVGEDRETMSGTAQLTQVLGGLFRRTERNQVPKALVDRKEGDALPIAVRPERRVELVGAKAGREEVAIVHQCVADARVGQIGREVGLPDSLGEPQPHGVHTEARPHRLAHPLDLLDAISAGEARREPARSSPRAGSRSSRRPPVGRAGPDTPPRAPRATRAKSPTGGERREETHDR